MRKFKRIFYPIYLIFILAAGYFAIRSLFKMDQMLLWYQDTFSETSGPYWIAIILCLLSLLMLVSLIAENIHLKQIKDSIPEFEDEIVRLKAKLFDQSDVSDEDDEEDESDEDDDDED